MDAPARPVGRHRGVLFAILMTIVTLGIYSFYWVYVTMDELKRHRAQGVGGGLGLVIYIFIGIVTPFLVASEVGQLYREDGQVPPISGWWGLWILLPLVGGLIWFIVVQRCLNDFWQGKARASRPSLEARAARRRRACGASRRDAPAAP